MNAPASSAREEKLQRIIGVLASLPLLPDQSADSVQDCAERLLIVDALKSVNDLPRANVGTTKKAIAELDEFGKLSARLIELVYRIHKTSLTALKTTPKQRVILQSSAVGNPEMSEIGRHPFVVASDLRALALAAAAKIKELKSAPPSKEPGPPSRKVRVPRKRHAADVTEAAAKVFEQLTGKKAVPHSLPDGTDGGPFVKFLDDLFAALEINAKAGAQARAFMELGTQKKTVETPLH